MDRMDVDRKQKVLIVDDVRLNTKILAAALQDEYELAIATNGKDALEIANSDEPPDIILLDIIMPEMDGYEVCAKLQEQEQTRDIPVIFLTALEGAEEEAYGLELGAIDYIRKPFNVPVVKAKIRNHLERKRYQDLLERDSRIDKLTRIANRRRFDEVFFEEARRTRRTGNPLSLVMIDIDSFKRYNDLYGHLKGDETLRTVAQTLQQSLMRPGDFVARWGGEEFMCILPDTDRRGAMVVAERLRRAVEDLKIVHDHAYPTQVLTVSVGIATSDPTNDESTGWLLSQADAALYEAKRLGRNRVAAFDSP